MRINSASDICKKSENQDNFWCSILNINGNEMGVLCVCDGMGGLNDGGLASSHLVRRIREHFLLNGSIENLESVILESDWEIKNSTDKVTGTTCTILACYEGYYYIYSVGDTRCYKWSNNSDYVEQLTRDHTVIQKFKSEGKEITEEVEKKYRNVLTRCVGMGKGVKYDTFSGSYSKGDNFLVCSDGFWHTLSNKDFLDGSIFNLHEMLKKCIDYGESDNITACILSI